MTTEDIQEIQDDRQRLNEIWESKKDSLGVTQGSVASMLGYSQPTINGYLYGKSKLNVTVASAFAQALECKVSDFSPSLQKEIDHLCLFGSSRADQNLQLISILNKNPGWPFASISPEDIESLSTQEKRKVEGLLEGYLFHLKNKDSKPR